MPCPTIIISVVVAIRIRVDEYCFSSMLIKDDNIIIIIKFCMHDYLGLTFEVNAHEMCPPIHACAKGKTWYM